LTLSEFEDKVKAGLIRHVGFEESIQLIAAAWGVKLSKIEERVLPVMATRPLESQFVKLSPGQVCGLNQIAQGFVNDKAVITLNLQAYFGHPHPQERILIQGQPPLEMVIPGGIPGDVATCAMTVNAISRVASAPAGLRTMLDVGLTSSLFC
ncbi:MAG: dihydrodipicolinate reductase, partial [Deltaproteobacteria bacterium]|nr:dihydrodipicolinate reductase [Deltaproteobacteria bacterium]